MKAFPRSICIPAAGLVPLAVMCLAGCGGLRDQAALPERPSTPLAIPRETMEDEPILWGSPDFPDEPIDLSAAISLAVRGDPLLQIAWTRVLEAQADESTAGADFYPTVVSETGVSREEQGSSSGRSAFEETVYRTALRLSYTVYDFGGERRHRLEATRSALLANELRFNRAFQDLVLAVQRAYFAVQRQKAELAVARETVEEARKTWQPTRRLHEAGSATIQETYQARARFEETRFQREAATPRGDRWQPGTTNPPTFSRRPGSAHAVGMIQRVEEGPVISLVTVGVQKGMPLARNSHPADSRDALERRPRLLGGSSVEKGIPGTEEGSCQKRPVSFAAVFPTVQALRIRRGDHHPPNVTLMERPPRLKGQSRTEAVTGQNNPVAVAGKPISQPAGDDPDLADCPVPVESFLHTPTIPGGAGVVYGKAGNPVPCEKIASRLPAGSFGEPGTAVNLNNRPAWILRPPKPAGNPRAPVAGDLDVFGHRTARPGLRVGRGENLHPVLRRPPP